MAKTFENARLQIKYDCGLGDDNKTIVKSKSYSDVRQNVEDTKIRAVVNAINGLVSADHSELEAKLITTEIVTD